MLFPESDADHLKNWIITRLKDTSDADPDVLADYMLALLRHEGSVEAVRALCEHEIGNFLEDGSSAFVQDVFDALHYKSYLPGAPPAPSRKASAPFAPPTGPALPAFGGMPVGVPGAPLGPQNGSKKRSFNDRGDGDAQDRGYQPGGDLNGRAYKQPRRGGPTGGNTGRGGFNNINDRGGYMGRGAPVNPQGLPPPNFAGMPPMPSPPPGMPPLDPNNPLAALLAMQQLQQAMGLPPISPMNKGPAQSSKPRCRDYDQKGYCVRGSSCKFEHGQDSVFVPPTTPMDEYDPSNSSLMTGIESNSQTAGSNALQGGDRGRGRGGFPRGRGSDRGGHTLSRRGGRAEFSSDRPNFDKTRTTIVVEQIPEEKFEEAHVKEFFSQFGNIVEVTMRPYKRLAIVKYDDYQGAKNAYDSPKVIFDNRFVKVYWYINLESLPQQLGNGAPKPSNGTKAEDVTLVPRQPSEPAIDPVEFAKKQEEAQKAHEEKMKKKQEVDAARLDLEKRLESQAEEKRQLMAKIAAMSAKKSASPAPVAANGTAPKASEGMSEAAKLLAKLEAEAQSLGLDTTLTASEPWASRGRGRGRGRGDFRGRGTFAPRGFRGGFRGRGGAPFGGGGAYKLDNRTKKVGIKGVDFTVTEKQESLREHLFTIDSTAEIDISPDLTTVLFKDRYTAEKFMGSAPAGDLLPVGKVELSWVQTPLAPVKPKTIEDSAMDEGDAMASAPTPTRYEHAAENFDYDVADDSDWANQ
ncbi:hypothetical protein B0O99DRAFT_576039 [Bisporella sp. PMI_857]|nr:hypothetical protein B0O99DRAFT_576039 [Bisporella sp. PMI_857]